MTVSQVNTFTVHKARATRPGALLLARAVLAAAALPLLGAAVRHAACARGPRADVLDAARARARHHASQFPPGSTFQHWRMASYVNMAKPFVSSELRFAAVR